MAVNPGLRDVKAGVELYAVKVLVVHFLDLISLVLMLKRDVLVGGSILLFLFRDPFFLESLTPDQGSVN